LLRTPWRNPLIESAFQIDTFGTSVTTSQGGILLEIVWAALTHTIQSDRALIASRMIVIKELGTMAVSEIYSFQTFS
jgi:hypothetical protein